MAYAKYLSLARSSIFTAEVKDPGVQNLGGGQKQEVGSTYQLLGTNANGETALVCTGTQQA
jgi:hypothetical protein